MRGVENNNIKKKKNPLAEGTEQIKSKSITPHKQYTLGRLRD